ncbi:uncharacterized protein LOC130429385 [Triplophysa dalaica]|uniref:uncharacterized protein LOC130429385 n=1 Tax=Triplophysa dalaica TaxID=1582913 RepID=UPI0024DF5BCB|nr:uncharacterized protein LOC130429385 [Triplophysa dalaica]
MRSFIHSIVLLHVCGVFGTVTDEKSVEVYEGESVTLHNDETELQNTDTIRWRFGEEGSAKLLVEMTGIRITKKDLDDGRFRDRLELLDSKTGSLIIKNIRHKHFGRYEAEINHRTGTAYLRFRVTVKDTPIVFRAEQSNIKSESLTEGGSVTLHTDVQTQRGDMIVWRFGEDGVLLAKGDKEDNKSSVYDDVLDGMFRDRLKLDDHTGSLIIINTKTTDTGVYKLQIINNRDTKYKTFSVSVSEPGLSARQVTGIICGFLLVFAVVGVIVYRCIKYEQQKQKITVMTVPEGHSVTLESDVTKPQSDDVIELSYRDKVIATLNKNKISSHEERFRDRLKMDDQTGSFTITYIRTEDAGLYKVKISSSSRVKSFLQFITCRGPLYRQFNVIVTERIRSVEFGHSVILSTHVTGIQRGDKIQWTFEDDKTLIAEMTVGTEPSYDSTDERFRNRLKMNQETGDLTITHITAKRTGVYKAQIISRKIGTE